MGTFRRRWPGVSYGRGEDWHYVGEAGEPAFGGDWENVGSTWPALAFRLREAGVVDVVGVIAYVDTGGSEVFVAPDGYRPASGRMAFVQCYVKYTGSPQLHEAGVLSINDTGYVQISGPGLTSGSSVVYVSGSYFLTPPASSP